MLSYIIQKKVHRTEGGHSLRGNSRISSSVARVKLWNSLNRELKECQKAYHFKQKCKEMHFLTSSVLEFLHSCCCWCCCSFCFRCTCYVPYHHCHHHCPYDHYKWCSLYRWHLLSVRPSQREGSLIWVSPFGFLPSAKRFFFGSRAEGITSAQITLSLSKGSYKYSVLPTLCSARILYASATICLFLFINNDLVSIIYLYLHLDVEHKNTPIWQSRKSCLFVF